MQILDITIGSYVLMYFKNNTPDKIDLGKNHRFLTLKVRLHDLMLRELRQVDQGEHLSVRAPHLP